MPPPNLPIRPALRSPSLDYDTDAGGVLSPTQHAQPSLLELGDLLEDLKSRKQAESSLGADRFLVKPVDLDDVVAMVRRTVKERTRPPSAP